MATFNEQALERNNEASESNKALMPTTVRSEFNGLEFAPRKSADGKDRVSPGLLETEEGKMFKPVSGGSSGVSMNINAPFLESKIQGRREPSRKAPRVGKPNTMPVEGAAVKAAGEAEVL